MPLRQLANNSGQEFYPNHNTPSTAGGFNYNGWDGSFRQSDLKFGDGTSFDRAIKKPFPFVIQGGFKDSEVNIDNTIDLRRKKRDTIVKMLIERGYDMIEDDKEYFFKIVQKIAIYFL